MLGHLGDKMAPKSAKMSQDTAQERQDEVPMHRLREGSLKMDLRDRRELEFWVGRAGICLGGDAR